MALMKVDRYHVSRLALLFSARDIPSSPNPVLSAINYRASTSQADASLSLLPFQRSASVRAVNIEDEEAETVSRSSSKSAKNS